jgi:hypothetical protein
MAIHRSNDGQSSVEELATYACVKCRVDEAPYFDSLRTRTNRYRFPQRLCRLFSLPPNSGIPRETKKPSAAVLRCAAGLTAAGRSLPGPRTAIEAAIGAARRQNGDHHGYHRHFHRIGQRLDRFGQNSHAQRQGEIYRRRSGQRQGARLPHLRGQHRLCEAKHYAERYCLSAGFPRVSGLPRST